MNYKKITKGQARKLFNAGKEIYLHTNKLSWNNPWQNPMPAKFDEEHEKSQIELWDWKIQGGYNYEYDANGNKVETKRISQFDWLVSDYAYYNCDKERGNVVIYLIPA